MSQSTVSTMARNLNAATMTEEEFAEVTRAYWARVEPRADVYVALVSAGMIHPALEITYGPPDRPRAGGRIIRCVSEPWADGPRKYVARSFDPDAPEMAPLGADEVSDEAYEILVRDFWARRLPRAQVHMGLVRIGDGLVQCVCIDHDWVDPSSGSTIPLTIGRIHRSISSGPKSDGYRSIDRPHYSDAFNASGGVGAAEPAVVVG